MSAQRVLFDAPGPRARTRHRLFTVLGLLGLALVLGWVVMRFAEQDQLTAEKWSPFAQSGTWTNYLLPGLQNTLRAAGIAIVLSLVLGLVLSMGRMSEHRLLRWPAGVFVEFFRAVPVLIMMIFAFFFMSYNDVVSADIVPLTAVVTGLTLYNSSVIAEVIRSGVASLPAGQREAGLAVGLRSAQVRRSILVPQALTAMLPALISQLVVVLKDSALGYIITYSELLNNTRQLGSRYANLIPAFLVTALIYILINYLITKIAERLESRLRRKGRATLDADEEMSEAVPTGADPAGPRDTRPG